MYEFLVKIYGAHKDIPSSTILVHRYVNADTEDQAQSLIVDYLPILNRQRNYDYTLTVQSISKCSK